MHIEFEAIGTWWQIDGVTSLPVRGLEQEIRDLIEEYDRIFSRFRTDSLVWKMNTTPGVFPLPDEAKSLFEYYKLLYDLTDGLVTPLIGNALSDLGYDKDYSLTPKKATSPPSWESTINYLYPALTVKHPILIDIGAVGKGQLIDIIGDYLESKEIVDYIVDAGGDIRQRGKSPIRVGLEHPQSPKSILGVVSLHGKSICGSAGNRRAWNTFHHMLNPKTLESPTNILATWVVSDSTMIADGLSTSLFFVQPELLATTYTFDYMIVYADYSIKVSDTFSNELYIK